MSSERTAFAGRTALVTGAASGIGAACARWLAHQGAAELILIDRNAAALEALDLACENRRIEGDVADPALWARVETEIHQLDGAVLNAGISAAAPITDLDFTDWRRIMAVNLDGAFLSLRTTLRLMQPAGRGSIVLSASASGIKAAPGAVAYSVSKAAVIHLAKVAAAEAAPHGVRVNAIAPGGVDTPIWDETPFFQALVDEHGGREAAVAAMGKLGAPLGRFASAEEIAAQIGFLLGDAAATITGPVLVSDGGYTL
jgi:NAD(P)-dependent dehydrogenase (short-subunit alcohol dehydrogenase family)